MGPDAAGRSVIGGSVTNLPPRSDQLPIYHHDRTSYQFTTTTHAPDRGIACAHVRSGLAAAFPAAPRPAAGRAGP